MNVNSKAQCDPKEVQLKSFFLGPKAENAEWFRKIFVDCFDRWVKWRKKRFERDCGAISLEDQEIADFQERIRRIEVSSLLLAERYEQELPKFSPRYLAHMFSDISLPALVGHLVTLFHNPNNISRESSQVGTEIEKEAIAFLAEMVRYPLESIGHFTSGGTLANIEALVRARAKLSHQSEANLSFSHVLLAPANVHYSWYKGMALLGYTKEQVWLVDLDCEGRMNVEDLKHKLLRAKQERRLILMVVSVLGSTELGSMDPVDQVNQVLLEEVQKGDFPIWHHVDAAYGGYFCSLSSQDSEVSDRVHASLAGVCRANSITLDPHKLGYVPYSAGAFLVRDPKDYFYKLFDEAPYLDFNHEQDRGAFAIEGSRSAAGASATWMTAQTMDFNPNGYGLLLSRTIRVKNELQKTLEQLMNGAVFLSTDTNLLCFFVKKTHRSLKGVNQETRRCYERLKMESSEGFYLSKSRLDSKRYSSLVHSICEKNALVEDEGELFVVRMSLMNPFLGACEGDYFYKNRLITFLTHFIN
jgi:glutamate/tyrosine decarboxylase-like PLP-dependent enzyme